MTTEIDKYLPRFKDHQIKHVLNDGHFQSFVCEVPGDSNFAFTVTTIPYWLYVSGDIGHMAFWRQEDMLSWLFRGYKDISYLSSKAQEVPIEEFNLDFAKQQVREWIKDLDKEWQEESEQDCDFVPTEKEYDRRNSLEEALDATDENEFYSSLSTLDDFPSGNVWTQNYLRCYAALFWFVQNVKLGA